MLSVCCTLARSVRKAEDAEALAAELGDFFSPLVFDVTDPKAIAAAAAEVRSRVKGRPLLGLVNNAGAQQPQCTLHPKSAPAPLLTTARGLEQLHCCMSPGLREVVHTCHGVWCCSLRYRPQKRCGCP